MAISVWPVAVIGGSALALLAIAASQRAEKKLPDNGLPRVMTAEEIELLSPPLKYSAERDQIWIRYVVDPTRPGPPFAGTSLSSKPVRRELSDFEWWALSPFFDNPRDLSGRLNIGFAPSDSAARVADNSWAATAEGPTGTPEIWIPRVIAPHDLWWLGRLAHQFVHAAQMRDGGKIERYSEGLVLTNIIDNAAELAAIEMQKKVMAGLAAEARAFYAEPNPAPAS